MCRWFVLPLLLVVGSAIAGDVNSGKPAAPNRVSGEPGVAMLYGHKYFFGVKAPSGWVLDNSSGAAQGLDAVFYPQGSSWDAFDPVIYPQVWQKDGSTLASVIEEDIANYRQHSPSVEVEERPVVKTAIGATARLRYFRGSKNKSFEAIAYFDEPNVVVMIVMSAKSKASFESAQPAFRELLESYKFVGEFERLPESDQKQSP
jgi:hypothetical protein